MKLEYGVGWSGLISCLAFKICDYEATRDGLLQPDRDWAILIYILTGCLVF